jgi:hypothetical protein
MPHCDTRSATAALAFWLVATGAAVPVRADVRSFGNWIVGCDNKAECTALGIPESPVNSAAPAVVLRIGVDRASLSGFEFAIVPLPNGDAATRPITVTCPLCADGGGEAGDGTADRLDLHGRRITIPGMQGVRWMDALGKGRRIAVAWAGGGAGTTIDTSAFLEAWVHLAQTRGDLLRQALIVEGLPSLRAGQPPPERRRAFPAREVMPSGTPAIAGLPRRCPPGGEPGPYRQFVLPGSATLWAVECREGRTLTTRWYQASAAADVPSRLELPDGERARIDAGEGGFEESVFDFDFGILRARSGPADREDCGIRRAWGWDGEAWFLLERREMPACIGLPPTEWIRTYSSP